MRRQPNHLDRLICPRCGETLMLITGTTGYGLDRVPCWLATCLGCPYRETIDGRLTDREARAEARAKYTRNNVKGPVQL